MATELSSWACDPILSIISGTYCGWFHLPRENSMPDQEGHSYVKFRLFDWPPLLGPVTSFFSLAVQPTLQDTDRCSACSRAVVDRKNRAGSLMDKLFIGQKESEGWDSISTEGTNGRKTLVLPCCVYCGHSVCPGCRLFLRACCSSSHIPLTFYLLSLGTLKLPFNCHPLELFVINLKGTQPEF